MSMMHQKKANQDGKLKLDDYIQRGVVDDIPSHVPMPRWFKEKSTQMAAAPTRVSVKNHNGDLPETVGDVLKFYSRMPLTKIHDSPAPIEAVHPDTEICGGSAQFMNQDHVTTVGPPGLLLPSNPRAEEHCEMLSSPIPKRLIMPNTKPLHGSGDARNSCNSTLLKREVATDSFPRAPCLSVPWLPLQLGAKMDRTNSPFSRSKSSSPEPEPSPTGSVDRAYDLSALAAPDQQVRFDCFPTALRQSPTSCLSNWQPEWEQEVQDGHRDPKIQLARDIAANGGGLSGYATVMIQQIPFKYTQGKLLSEINDNGFAGKYDFFYLPANARNHGNRGFGFINFLTAAMAEEFYSKYHGKILKHGQANLPIAVIPADAQGFEQSAACFFSSWQLRKKKRHSMPVFLRPVPGESKLQGKCNGF